MLLGRVINRLSGGTESAVAGVSVMERDNLLGVVATTVKKAASTVLEVADSIESLNKQLIADAVNVLPNTLNHLSLNGIADLNERVVTSTAMNWDLWYQTEKTKKRFEAQSNVGPVISPQVDPSQPIVVQHATSSASIADLAKSNYKELYAVYQLGTSELHDWRELLFVDDIKSGLNARVFVNEKSREVNISFEGSHGFTKLLAENVLIPSLLKDIQEASDNFSHPVTDAQYDILYNKWKSVLGADGLSDLQMLAGKVPDQFYSAYTWLEKVMEQLSGSQYFSYNKVISGHSLGGAMAQMVSAQYYLDYKQAIPTIALQGPGVLSQINQLNHQNYKPEDFSHIINFVTEADLVGEFQMDQHIGITVPMPYTMARNDEFWNIKYRWGLNIFQNITDMADIRIDRHDIGQQIDLFNGTNFSYPENKVILSSDNNSYTSTSNKQEIIVANRNGCDIYGGNMGTYLVGGAGNDHLYGGAGNDFIVGGEGDDYLVGGAGDNLLYGGVGNDYLIGGVGNDELFGGSGNDTLVWTGGNDLLYGQGGDDTYILGNLDGKQASGKVTLKFDQEAPGNDHVLFNINAMDIANTHISLFMSDNILPSSLSLKSVGKDLYIQYGNNSSITLDNWSDISKTVGDHLTICFGGSPLPINSEYRISNNALVKLV